MIGLTKKSLISKVLIDSREQKMANKSLIFFKNRKILVMTDPDDAGFSIEKRLKETGLKYETRFVDSKMCNKHGKHGVAECKKEERQKWQYA